MAIGTCQFHGVAIQLIEVLEIQLSFGETGGLGLAGVGDHFLRVFHLLRNQVADGLDLDTIDRQQISQQTGAASTDSDDSQAHSLPRFKGNAHHCFVGGLR